MEGYIRIYRMPKGRGTDQLKLYCPSQRRGQYHFHWFVPGPKGSLSILILNFISLKSTCDVPLLSKLSIF